MKKKLVFFIGGLNFGGMERVVFIAKDLLKDYFDITIVTQYQQNADYEKDENYYNLDVPPSRNKLFVFIKRLKNTIKMKRELKPDFVFSFGMYANYLNIISNKFIKYKPKTIAGIRSYDWLTIPFLTHILDKYIMSKFDSINSVSKMIANDAEKYWNIPIEKNIVLYNPYDINEISEKAKEKIEDYSFEKDKFYITTMGRLTNQKGYNCMIRAMSLVVGKHKNVKLLIMGNGEKKDELLKMIDEYGLSENIELIGGKKNPYKYIFASDLYVLSSITEGFPNALSEAMCVGTPVVSVNCKSGPSEILCDTPYLNIDKKSILVSDYGILTKEMIQDNNYSKRNINSAEKSLADGIIYAIENRNEVKIKAKDAKEHMKQYSYDKFRDNLLRIIK